jgi:hypothetical protein
MHKLVKPVLVTLFLTLVLSGCHHNVATAKVPQTPPTSASPSVAAPTVKSSTPQTNAVTAKTPELTTEQLFAKNIRDIFFSYDNIDVQAAEQPALSADALFWPAIQP